jgi:hypothetical protein
MVLEQPAEALGIPISLVLKKKSPFLAALSQ